MERIRLDLEGAEYRGLVRLAEQDLRSVAEEARHIIREALRGRGLLITSTAGKAKAPPDESAGPRP